ncbi:hypothetical protein Pelo_2141 [Pelomyxa schiedti]|nr:hypothetical protein Pelo_2141 [Pelomyxa schiedti]
MKSGSDDIVISSPALVSSSMFVPNSALACQQQSLAPQLMRPQHSAVASEKKERGDLFKSLRRKHRSKSPAPTSSPPVLSARRSGVVSCDTCVTKCQILFPAPYASKNIRPLAKKLPDFWHVIIHFAKKCKLQTTRPENGAVGLALDGEVLKVIQSQGVETKIDSPDTAEEELIATLPQGVSSATICEEYHFNTYPGELLLVQNIPHIPSNCIAEMRNLLFVRCALFSHKGHNIVTIEEAVADFRQIARSRLNTARQQLTALTNSYALLSDMSASSELSTERAALHIQIAFHELHRAASDREASLIAEVIAKSRIEELQCQCKNLARSIRRRKDLLSGHKLASLSISDIELLWEKNTIVQEIDTGMRSHNWEPCITRLYTTNLEGKRFLVYKSQCTEVVEGQIVLNPGRVYEFKTVHVKAKGILTAPAWDGHCGGWLKLRVLESVTVDKGGTIDMSAKGYAGGLPTSATGTTGVGFQGDSPTRSGQESKEANGGGGGGCMCSFTRHCCGGGGGGFGTPGGDSASIPQGGIIYGNEELSPPWMGSGGGSGFIFSQEKDCTKEAAEGGRGGRGGRGGGVIHICAKTILNCGTISSDGENGAPAVPSEVCTQSTTKTSGGGGGGGGAGGSILLQADTLLLNEGEVHCLGGFGGACAPHAISARLSGSFQQPTPPTTRNSGGPFAPAPSTSSPRLSCNITRASDLSGSEEAVVNVGIGNGGLGGYGRIRFDYQEYQGEGLVVPLSAHHQNQL